MTFFEILGFADCLSIVKNVAEASKCTVTQSGMSTILQNKPFLIKVIFEDFEDFSKKSSVRWQNQLFGVILANLGNFPNASPSKCLDHFRSYSTQVMYYVVLQTDRLSASVHISIVLAMAYEHGRKMAILTPF